MSADPQHLMPSSFVVSAASLLAYRVRNAPNFAPTNKRCCNHSLAISADRWPDDVRLSDIEDRFTCTACGKRGADARPDFNWGNMPVKAMGYR